MDNALQQAGAKAKLELEDQLTGGADVLPALTALLLGYHLI